MICCHYISILLALLLASGTCIRTLSVSPKGSGSLCDPVSPCDLPTAVSSSQNGDTLLLSQGTYSGSMFPLYIRKNMTIVGDGRGVVILSGSNLTRILDVEGVSVSLALLTLSDGMAFSGAALYVANGGVTLKNCTFANNFASATMRNSGGGALYLNNSVASVLGCTFRNCSSGWVGGAIAAVYNASSVVSAFVLQGPLLSVLGSTFSRNIINSSGQAQGSAVGVIFDVVAINDTSVVFAKNAVLENISTGYVGDTQGAFAVYYVMNSGNNSVISTQNSFEGNNASTGQGNCYGGGISVYYLKIARAGKFSSVLDAFRNNSCIATTQGNAMGGGIALHYGEDAIDTRGLLQSGEFTGNTANGHYSGLGGGASVFVNGQTTGFALSGGPNVFRGNTAFSGGEGSALGGGLNVFFNNRAADVTITDSGSRYLNNSIATLDSQEGSCLGGGLSLFFNSQVAAVQVVVNNALAQFNTATDTGNQGQSYGGGISIFFNENQHDNPGASITNSLATQNFATSCANVFAEFQCT